MKITINRPIFLFIFTLSTAFFAEIIIMLVMRHLNITEYAVVTLVDASLLTIILFPASYFSILKPLSDMNKRLKQQVDERTGELTESNKKLEEEIKLSHIILNNMPCVAMLINMRTKEVLAKNELALESEAPQSKQCFAWTKQNKPCPWCQSPNIWPSGKSLHTEAKALGMSYDIHWVPITKELYLHYIFDITAHKKLEAELEEAKRSAESANYSKSKFLAHMSHEIRTPMNGIIGFSDILMESNLTKEQKELLEVIKSSADALLEIINDILDISKVEANELILEEVCFDIEVLIHDICRLIKFKSDERKTEVIVDIGEIPILLLGDPSRLRQIIVNLMGNACKFTESGEIILRVSLVNEEDKSVELKFAVEDTGIGIPKDKLNFIFNPFSQAESSTTRKFGGTGLGLTISQKLSKKMGGEIWVESKEGEGSCFYFTAKFKKAKPHRKARTPIKPKELSQKQAIVVDNNKNALKIITRMLKKYGIDPVSFDDAESAIEYLKSCERLPDFGIIDMIMPKIDGVGFMKLLKNEGNLSKIPMIAHTTHSCPGTASSCKVAGFMGYLPKPTRKQSLLNVICTILGFGEIKEEKEIVTQHSARDDILKNTRILVAEDNKINQKLIVKILGRWGCKVDIADDGLVAVNKVKESNYDLVFMDMQMPNMGGLEATKEIRKTGNKIPIIAMTADAMAGAKELCTKSGMNDYLSKPIKKETVIETIEKWSIP